MRMFTRFCIAFLLISSVSFGACFAQTGSKKKSKSPKKQVQVKMAREIKWFQGKETDFEDSCRKWKKPAFLYIYLDNGDASASFEKNVLMDTSIINYVDSHFVAYKLNLEYDSPNAMKYMIDDVPAIILFSKKNGQEIDRIIGMTDKKEFRKFLKKAL